MKKKNSKISQNIVFKKPSLTLRVWNGIYPYRKAIISSFFILLIIGLIVAGWFSYQEWRDKKAIDFLYTAKEEKDYRKLVEDYSGTSAASFAMIHLAELKWKEGEFSKAREIYENFLEIYPKDMFAPLVRNLQGECLLQEKEFPVAENIFKSLLDNPQNVYIQSLVRINLGRLEMAKGNFQTAIDLFKSLKQEKYQMLWMDTIDAFIRRHENAKNVQN